MRTRMVSALLLAGVVAACSGAPARSDRPNRNVITAEEIAGVSGSTTAFDVVRQLRPEFLRSRGAGSFSGNELKPVIYMDNVRLGDPAQLSTIPVHVVERIEYVSATDATTRWGTGHTGGVISVTTRR